jgi:hypothetical protein
MLHGNWSHTLHVFFQNVFLVYHRHYTKHVRVPVGTANINANFHDIGVPGYFSNLATSETATL